MSSLKETKISSEQKFSGRLIDLYLDQVELPNGETTTREWIDHPGAVCRLSLIPISEPTRRYALSDARLGL